MKMVLLTLVIIISGLYTVTAMEDTAAAESYNSTWKIGGNLW